MRQLKLTALVVLVLIGAIVIAQNLEPVETKLIVTTVKTSLATLLACTLAIGYAFGLLTTAMWKMRSRRTQALARRVAAANSSDMPAVNSDVTDS